MKDKIAQAHMKAALVYAELSYCKRKQVGCVIVKDDRIISIGFNGTPPGWENVCEDDDGITRPEVVHAEANALAKLAKSNESGDGSICFITCQPCLPCAMLLVPAGIKEVYYLEKYGCDAGEDFLKECGVTVQQLKLK